MTVRSALRSATPFTLSAVAFVFLAAGCSAPPGADTGDDGVPEFGGLPSATPGAGGGTGTANPPTASAGTTGAPPVAAGTGGSTGAPSNEQPGGNNVGLDPNQNNGQNGGQNQGAGGSMMAGAAGNPGNNGAAGAPANPPVQGNAGSSSMPPGDNNQQPQDPPPQEQPQNPPPQEQPQNPPQAANCGNAFVCDDFEGVAAGASPNAAVWQIVQNFSNVDQSAAVVVSGENSRSGGQALRVTGSDGRTGIVASIPQTSYFVRAFLQVDTVRTGTVFFGLGADQNSENRFRIQNGSFATINVNPGDDVRPLDANNGNGCPDCTSITPNQWFCAEMAIDSGARTATLFIDGNEVAVAGSDVFVNQPATPAAFIGSWGLQGGVSSVWVDDVAIAAQRIGCD